MKLQLANKFLHRVRIHGGEFDSSARAMNREEESNLFQAELRKFRGSTFERKQMSTTIKRVALVAVAALGLGVMSVAPSQAAAQLDSISVSAATAAQVTGETLTAGSVVVTSTLAGTKGVDTLTVTATIVSGPAYIQPTLQFKESTTAVASASASVATVTPRDTSTVTQATGKFYLYLQAPTTAGTYVVKLTPTGGTNAVATTVSITVTAAVVPGISATYSTVAMNTTDCSFGAVWQYNNCYAAGGSGAGTYTYAIATDTVTATATVNKDRDGDSDNSLLELQSSTKPFHSKRPTSVLAGTHLTSHERPSLSQMSSTPSLKRPREPDSHNSDTSLSLPSPSQFSSSLVPSPLGTSPLEPSPISSLLRQHILLTPDGSFSPDKVPTEVPRDPFLDSTDYPPTYKDDDEDVDSDDSI